MDWQRNIGSDGFRCCLANERTKDSTGLIFIGSVHPEIMDFHFFKKAIWVKYDVAAP